MIHCLSEKKMKSYDADTAIAINPVATPSIDILGVLMYLSVAKLLLQL